MAASEAEDVALMCDPGSPSSSLWVLSASAILVPNVFLVGVFSSMGFGLDLFSRVASPSASRFGDVAISLGVALLCTLYILGCAEWNRLLQATAALIVFCVFGVGSVFKGVKYPWAPTVWVLLLMLLVLLKLRRDFKHVQRRRFALMLGVIFLACTTVVCFLWLMHVGIHRSSLHQAVQEESHKRGAAVYEYFQVSYGDDCASHADKHLSSEAQDEVEASCAKANNVMVITWALPFAAGCIDMLCAVFFFFPALRYPEDEGASVTGSELYQVATLFFVLLTLLSGGLYVSSYLLAVSANLTLPALGLLLAGVIVACAWIHVEKLGLSQVLGDHEDEFLKIFEESWQSTWVKAMAVGSGFVPGFYILESSRQYVRQRMGAPEQPDMLQPARSALEDIQKWPVTDILVKICVLGEIFFVLQILGTKVTYVFLAWMNEQLAESSLELVVLIAFIVGFSMFLLPPVPGVPVYIFCGIVVVARGKGVVGFWGACGLAIVLSLALKLMACTGQYFIGVMLGRSLHVRKFIGVDKPVTRAIEKIVADSKLCAPDKVAVLVGGPDWPTSVTCGILRVSLWKMLVGTLWCFFSATPCVLAGAFLQNVAPGEDDTVDVFLGSFFTILAAVVQMGSMLWATLAIGLKLQGDPTLVRDEEKYADLKKLRRAEEAFNDKYTSITKWDNMGSCHRALILVAACLIFFTGCAFVALEGTLFENFSVSGRISDDLDEYGLGKDPLAIVKPPGWFAIGLFCVGALSHVLFNRLTTRKAAEGLKEEEQGLLGEGL